MGLYLPPLDDSRQFVCQAFFRANGVVYSRGQPFPKDAVDARILRLLYEGRKIYYAAAQAEAAPAGKKAKAKKGKADAALPPLAPSPQADPEEQAAALAAGHTKAQLLAMASGIEGVSNQMNKAQLAQAIVRAGHGVS